MTQVRFDDKCIKCGATSELDTMLTVSLDEGKFNVAVCDKHSEDITPKEAKTLVKQKLDELNKLLKELSGFGYDVNSLGKIAVATQKDPSPAEPAPAVEEQEKPTGLVIANAKGEIIGEKQVGKGLKIKKNTKMLSKVKSIGGAASGAGGAVNLEMRQSLNADDSVDRAIVKAKESGAISKDAEVIRPVTEEVEMQVVRGRGGVPMQIPAKIKHNIGTTRVSVVDTGGDQMLQNRFRQFADHTKRSGGEGHIYGRDGMDVSDCPMCEGTGTARVGGGKCPKCDGVGLLERGWNRR